MNWTERTPSASPPFVLHGNMAFDPVRRVVVLWGGIGYGGVYLTETWTWDGTDWTMQTPATSPPGRDAAMLEWDGSNIVLYGGVTDGVRRADMWAWDGETWTQLADSAAPGVCAGAVMTFDETRAQLVLQGGSSDTHTLEDTWTWDGEAGAAAADTQPGPPGRRGRRLGREPCAPLRRRSVRDRALTRRSLGLGWKPLVEPPGHRAGPAAVVADGS